jgi:hypothetical protein
LARLWRFFVIYSVVILLATAVFTFSAYSYTKTLPPEDLLKLNTMVEMMFGWILLIVGVVIFALVFVLLFVLSLFPTGRKIADELFNFTGTTELEKFKGEIKDKLTSINRRLNNVKTTTNKRLDNIEVTINDKLRNIETTLKTLTGSTNHIETPLEIKSKTKKKAE